MPKRKNITKKEQLTIWARDKWCCRYCGRPVIFAPALKWIAKTSRNNGYYHPHWKRENSPLLDELGATVDHIISVKSGGLNLHENYNTCCWRCNKDKSYSPIEDWGAVLESLPTNWDGFSSVFISLFRLEDADETDKRWFKLLTLY